MHWRSYIDSKIGSNVGSNIDSGYEFLRLCILYTGTYASQCLAVIHLSNFDVIRMLKSDINQSCYDLFRSLNIHFWFQENFNFIQFILKKNICQQFVCSLFYWNITLNTKFLAYSSEKMMPHTIWINDCTEFQMKLVKYCVVDIMSKIWQQFLTSIKLQIYSTDCDPYVII